MTKQKARDKKRAEEYSVKRYGKPYPFVQEHYLAGIRAERSRIVALVKKLDRRVVILHGVIKAIKGDRG